MPLTQIPLQPPPAERPLAHAELYDANTWESAYREMHDFPTLLIQARDDLARARKREAFWMSVVAHILLILVIINSPKFQKYLPHRTVMLVHSGRDNDKLTFLELPADTLKQVPHPETNIMSDKNRRAMSRTPQLDRKQLKKLLDATRAGKPGPVAPPAPERPMAPPPERQAEQSQAGPAEQPQPAPPPAQTARLQSPPVSQKPVFSTQPMSASRAIDQAAHEAALSHGKYAPGDNGDLGLGQRQQAARMGDAEIISDTMGVDFAPYLQRVLHDVKRNWYNLIPESAMPPLLKRGKVSIEFAITKNGQIAGLHYVSGSGDVALDRAAYGGITSSNPFPPLPGEFAGSYLGLRFTFLYNPDPNQADLH
ncbi:MAG: TonB C-terminal domain-containing protein [Acidobacteria bacterium]|nr:TonB C-terminal domain-containing protein [Acidobacteriota bacterium]MBV9623061.1 TonB C-terminal domain-containing protein [Acidobacteriota bacterium]